jgi:peptidoglycan/LPS O-acetylase OafA/YrhL
MGYQPSLDGVRAISVVAVLLYHAGFSWLHGGFLGVEVFFVVSGFLITSLLLDERERHGRVSLGQFWIRRARRLLPALVLVLVAVGVYAALWGSAQMQSDLRRDYPWSILYAANWGQIVGGAQYFGNLSPLRHLWSLAVEEQWYVVWPLLFLGLAALARSLRVRAAIVGAAALGVIVLTWWLARAPQLTDDRVNLLYLSTFTRASGLLLGAAAAFVWRPWRSARPQPSARAGLDPDAGGAAPLPPVGPTRVGWAVDLAAVVAVAVLLWSFVAATLTDRALYRWQLPVVSVASLVLVLAVVHPSSRLARPVFALRPLVEIGKRSYGLYLWSWPVSVVCEAYAGEWAPFVLAMAITVVLSELSYRFVETPIRHGALGRWFAGVRSTHWRTTTLAGGVAVAALVVPLGAFFASAEHVDPAAGGADAVFVLDTAALADTGLAAGAAPASSTPVTSATGPVATQATPPPSPAPEPLLGSAIGSSTDPAVASTVAETVPVSSAPPVTAPVLPRRVVVVGDSMANSLAINLPDGIESAFGIANGSVEGCSVYTDGNVRSARSFSRSFVNCEGWTDRWARAARESEAELALVVLGAWDVFDVEVDGTLVPFASPEGDARFLTGLQQGIDALVAEGAHVGLLEIACMRPQDVKGAGVPALPERGDDARVAHLNDLMRELAAQQPEHVTFVPGPVQWCTDEAVSSDLGYRWDGVHVYKPGANLIYTTIAPTLLRIPLPPR